MYRSSSNISLTSLLEQHAGDVLCSEGMQKEKDFSQHGGISCYDHSVAVAKMSVRMALRLRMRVDMESLIRGALLHDYFLYNWRDGKKEHNLHGFRHAQRALQNAQRDFPLSPIAKDVICRHMFPLNIHPPRYRESYIVTVADKVCATREFCRSLIRHLSPQLGYTGNGGD